MLLRYIEIESAVSATKGTWFMTAAFCLSAIGLQAQYWMTGHSPTLRDGDDVHQSIRPLQKFGGTVHPDRMKLNGARPLFRQTFSIADEPQSAGSGPVGGHL
jgi:hypothetical protein